jgi:hypothetical protein
MTNKPLYVHFLRQFDRPSARIAQDHSQLVPLMGFALSVDDVQMLLTRTDVLFEIIQRS